METGTLTTTTTVTGITTTDGIIPDGIDGTVGGRIDTEITRTTMGVDGTTTMGVDGTTTISGEIIIIDREEEEDTMMTGDMEETGTTTTTTTVGIIVTEDMEITGIMDGVTEEEITNLTEDNREGVALPLIWTGTTADLITTSITAMEITANPKMLMETEVITNNTGNM